MAKLNTKTSIVDYLKSIGQDSSFAARAKLAAKYGTKNYKGTAAQNTKLLNILRKQRKKAPAKTIKRPGTPKKPAATSTKTSSNPIIQRLQDSYKNSAAYKNQQRMINATIEDIAKKYGFDFSREYAERQAEALAQAERNAYQNSLRQNKSLYEQTMAQIEQDIRNANTALDHEYFQQMLNQQQAQAVSGLNAGIAADQNLRLAMSKQAQLSDVYAQANLARQQELSRYGNEAMRLREALDLVEQQRIARADEIYQQLRQLGYDILARDRDYANQTSQIEWGRISDQIKSELELITLAQQKALEQQRMALQRELEQARLKQERELTYAKLNQEKALAAQRLAAQRAAASAQSSSYNSLKNYFESLLKKYRQEMNRRSSYYSYATSSPYRESQANLRRTTPLPP